MSNTPSPSSGYTEIGQLLREAGESALSLPSNSDLEIAGYKLAERIGAGGMGATVFRAVSSGDPPDTVAIKVLPDSFALDDHLARRFRRESKVMQKIDHPHVVRMLDFGTVDSGQHFIVMEYLEGGSLADRLKEKGRLPTEEAIAIVLQVCDGLAALHAKQITHRDIKPGNILLNANGDAKLADFGLAKFLDPSSATGALTRSGDQLGTTAYMAPEQLAGSSSGDHSSDLYSLGVVLYQLLTGVVPHGHVNAPSVSRKELARYDEVVMRAINAERLKRFTNADEFREALSQAHKRAPKRRFSRRFVIIGLTGAAGATYLAWPPSPKMNLAWGDIDRAQRSVGNSDEFVIGPKPEETPLRFRLELKATTYRVEQQDVPSKFLKPIPLPTVLALRGNLVLLSRLVVKLITVSIPEGIRLDDATRKTLATPPTAANKSSDFVQFAQACRLLDRIESAGILRRTSTQLTIDPNRCPDYGAFCDALEIGSISVNDALKESAQRDALVRIGFYELLRSQESQPAPAVAGSSGFRVEEFTTRTPLEIIAALVAEPWLLPRIPELPWRPLYDGSLGFKDSLNTPTVEAVEQILEAIS